MRTSSRHTHTLRRICRWCACVAFVSIVVVLFAWMNDANKKQSRFLCIWMAQKRFLTSPIILRSPLVQCDCSGMVVGVAVWFAGEGVRLRWFSPCVRVCSFVHLFTLIFMFSHVWCRSHTWNLRCATGRHAPNTFKYHFVRDCLLFGCSLSIGWCPRTACRCRHLRDLLRCDFRVYLVLILF